MCDLHKIRKCPRTAEHSPQGILLLAVFSYFVGGQVLHRKGVVLKCGSRGLCGSECEKTTNDPLPKQPPSSPLTKTGGEISVWLGRDAGTFATENRAICDCDFWCSQFLSLPAESGRNGFRGGCFPNICA